MDTPESVWKEIQDDYLKRRGALPITPPETGVSKPAPTSEDVWNEIQSEYRGRMRGMPTQAIPTEPEAPTVGALGALPKGLYTSFRRRLPEMVGQAGEALGIPGAEAVTQWAKEGETAPKFTGSVAEFLYKTGEMVAPSVGPAAAGVALGVGALPAAIGGGALFGLSQYQQVMKAAEEKGIEPGIGPMVSGAIEALGETAGTYGLQRLFGPLAPMIKKGAKLSIGNVLRPTLGRLAKEFGMVTLPTEVGTEIGQQLGEAAVEERMGIRKPEYLKEALSVVGPTIGLSAFTLGLGGMARFASPKLQAVENVLTRPNGPAAISADDYKKIRRGAIEQVARTLQEADPKLADQFRMRGTAAVQAMEPIRLDMDVNEWINTPLAGFMKPGTTTVPPTKPTEPTKTPVVAEAETLKTPEEIIKEAPGAAAEPSAKPGATPTPEPSGPVPGAFTPTAEWQEIPEGIAIPPGLEIRMDMATGKNFARLKPEPIKTEAAPAKPEEAPAAPAAKPTTFEELGMEREDLEGYAKNLGWTDDQIKGNATKGRLPINDQDLITLWEHSINPEQGSISTLGKMTVLDAEKKANIEKGVAPEYTGEKVTEPAPTPAPEAKPKEPVMPQTLADLVPSPEERPQVAEILKNNPNLTTREALTLLRQRQPGVFKPAEPTTTPEGIDLKSARNVGESGANMPLRMSVDKAFGRRISDAEWLGYQKDFKAGQRAMKQAKTKLGRGETTDQTLARILGKMPEMARPKLTPEEAELVSQYVADGMPVNEAVAKAKMALQTLETPQAREKAAEAIAKTPKGFLPAVSADGEIFSATGGHVAIAQNPEWMAKIGAAREVMAGWVDTEGKFYENLPGKAKPAPAAREKPKVIRRPGGKKEVLPEAQPAPTGPPSEEENRLAIAAMRDGANEGLKWDEARTWAREMIRQGITNPDTSQAMAAHRVEVERITEPTEAVKTKKRAKKTKAVARYGAAPKEPPRLPAATMKAAIERFNDVFAEVGGDPENAIRVVMADYGMKNREDENALRQGAIESMKNVPKEQPINLRPSPAEAPPTQPSKLPKGIQKAVGVFNPVTAEYEEVYVGRSFRLSRPGMDIRPGFVDINGKFYRTKAEAVAASKLLEQPQKAVDKAQSFIEALPMAPLAWRFEAGGRKGMTNIVAYFGDVSQEDLIRARQMGDKMGVDFHWKVRGEYTSPELRAAKAAQPVQEPTVGAQVRDITWKGNTGTMKREGKEIGHITVDSTGRIVDLDVDSEYEGQGIGERLAQAAQDKFTKPETEMRKGAPDLAGGMTRQEIQSVVDKRLEELRNAPEVVITESSMDWPEHMREPGIIGAYDPNTGKIYMARNMMASKESVLGTLNHEAIGHYATLLMDEPRMWKFMDRLFEQYGREALEKETAEYGYTFDFNTLEGRRMAAREKFARLTEPGVKPVGVMEEIYAWVREQLAKIFPNMKLTDAEIGRFMRQASQRIKAPETLPGKLATAEAVRERVPRYTINELPDVIDWVTDQKVMTPDGAVGLLTKAEPKVHGGITWRKVLVPWSDADNKAFKDHWKKERDINDYGDVRSFPEDSLTPYEGKEVPNVPSGVEYSREPTEIEIAREKLPPQEREVADGLTGLILQRTRYGLRKEVAKERSRIATWSNGATSWGVTWRSVKRGEEVELDANEILVPQKWGIQRMQNLMTQRLVPPLPLFAQSFEAREAGFEKGVQEPVGQELIPPLIQKQAGRQLPPGIANQLPGMRFPTGGDALAFLNELSADWPQLKRYVPQKMEDGWGIVEREGEVEIPSVTPGPMIEVTPDMVTKARETLKPEKTNVIPLKPGGPEFRMAPPPGAGATMADFEASDPLAEAHFKVMKGFDRKPMLQGLKEALVKAKQSLFHHFPTLHDTSLFGVVRDILRTAETIPQRALAWADDMLTDIVKASGRPLSAAEMYGFGKIIVLEDAMKDHDAGKIDIDQQHQLGYSTSADLKADLARFKTRAGIDPNPAMVPNPNQPGQMIQDWRVRPLDPNNPSAIYKSLKKREEILDQYVQQAASLNLLPPAVRGDPRYYHHQVLDYMNLKYYGPRVSSEDLRTHGKGWQHKRLGSDKAYNTEYLESEYEFLAQLKSQIDTKLALDEVMKDQDIIADVQAMARSRGLRADNIEAVMNQFPDYVIWQPIKGRYLYRTLGLTEKVINQIFAGSTLPHTKANVPPGTITLDVPQDLRNVIGLGAPKQRWVIRKELAQTLDDFRDFRPENLVLKVSDGILTSWKQWILMNPLRVLKYNLNNFSGDLDIILAHSPKVVFSGKGILSQEFKDAVMNLYKDVRGKDLSPAQRSFLDLARRLDVIGSGITVWEIPDIKDKGIFQALVGDGKQGLVRKGVNWYWNTAKEYTNFRENVLRLAAFDYFLKQVNASFPVNNTPGNGYYPYGASRPAEIDALNPRPGMTPDEIRNLNERKAAKLARELLGDYGNLSQVGEWLRSHMIPFYSWMEINTPRYVRLFKNTLYEGVGTGAATRRIGTAATLKFAKFGVKATMLYSMATLYNRLFFPDEDDELNRANRGQLHLIIPPGRHADGSIMSIRFQGALSDALNWFGLEDFPQDAKDIIEGRKSIKKALGEFAIAPAQKMIHAARPMEKAVGEALLGRTLYPEILHPRPIRDRWEYLMKSVAMDMPYRYASALAGKAGVPVGQYWPGVVVGRPIKSVLTDVASLGAYRTEAGEASYYQTIQNIADWLGENGVEVPIVSPTQRSNALYYFKQAQRYRDYKEADKWLREYMRLGGKEKDIKNSIKKSHPISFVPIKLRRAWASSLDAEERKTYDYAVKWWQRTYGSRGMERE